MSVGDPHPEMAAILEAHGQAPTPALQAMPLAAGLDPMCDDSLMLADRLARHGVPCRLDIVPGVVHG